jgi:polysaccharide deacetylase 2 family uncharacterized protein YibQ
VWSFNPVQRAAIFFCLFLTALLALTSGPVVTGDAPPGDAVYANPRSLVCLHNSFKNLWRQYLFDQGLSPVLDTEIQKTLLQEKYAGTRKITWIKAEYLDTLPVSDSDSDLMQLGLKWKGISEDLGLRISNVAWGSDEEKIWLRLDNELVLTVEGVQLVLPLESITLVQPYNGSEKRFDFHFLIPEYLQTYKAEEELKKVEKEPKAAEPKQAEEVKTGEEAKQSGKNGETQRKYKAKIAIIIDDVGSVKETMGEFLKIDPPLAWAVLPFTPFARECALTGKEHGYEIMLHLPLEPVNDKEDPGPGMILRSFTENQIINQFTLDLLSVPGVVGVNNHMGSAGTGDERLMLVLMNEIKKRNLFFIDSVTTAHTVGENCAKLYRVPAAKRNVFIDNRNDFESKIAALEELLQYALKYGSAIGIGHARKGTGEAILAMLPKFAAAGVEVVPVSQLVK